jgi:hypothetical protein
MQGDLGGAAGRTGQNQGHHEDGRLAHGASLPPLRPHPRAGPGSRDWQRGWLGDELAFWLGGRPGRADQVPGARDHPAQPGRHLDSRPQLRGLEFGSSANRCALCGRLSPYLGGFALGGFSYRRAVPRCLP